MGSPGRKYYRKVNRNVMLFLPVVYLLHESLLCEYMKKYDVNKTFFPLTTYDEYINVGMVNMS